MKIAVLDLVGEYNQLKDEINHAVQRVLESGRFILSEDVVSFEKSLAQYTQCRFAFGVASGTDALSVALMALDIGPRDEVITTPFTFFATPEVIALCGATPVFVDIDPRTFNIDPTRIEDALTEHSKAIMPVDLYGQSCDMEPIMHIARTHGLKVIEDAAQALGAEHKDKKVCSLADIACLSFYPTKNLSCYGDGGALTTSDEELAKEIPPLRLHGARDKYHHEKLGRNSRLDAIQAAILSVKLKYLDTWNSRRIEIAARYDERLAECVTIPHRETYNKHAYHQYTIRAERRDELRQYLAEKGIPTTIYYPVPMHLQPALGYLRYKEDDLPEAEKAAKEVLSLPIYPQMSDDAVDYIAEAVREFYK